MSQDSPEKLDGKGKNFVSREEQTVIRIPDSLAERVRRRLPKTDFESVDHYISYVVEQVLNEVENSEGKAGDVKQQKSRGTSVLSKEEQKEVEERLKGLGYL